MNFAGGHNSVYKSSMAGMSYKGEGKHRNGQMVALPSPKGSQRAGPSKFPNGPSNHLVQCLVTFYLGYC